jgi:hypothetical protein
MLAFIAAAIHRSRFFSATTLSVCTAVILALLHALLSILTRAAFCVCHFFAGTARFATFRFTLVTGTATRRVFGIHVGVMAAAHAVFCIGAVMATARCLWFLGRVGSGG